VETAYGVITGSRYGGQVLRLRGASRRFVQDDQCENWIPDHISNDKTDAIDLALGYRVLVLLLGLWRFSD